MDFKEYCPPFEGNFFAEMEKLLGSDKAEFSRLQDMLGNPHQCSRENYLNSLREFYRIGTKHDIFELMVKADTLSQWLADEVDASIEGDSCLDVGCCDGLFAVFYAMHHPETRFTGIDISPDALAAADMRAKRYNVKNISWNCCDAFSAEAATHFRDAYTIIAQDVLYQHFGANDMQQVQKTLKMLYPHQKEGVAVITRSDAHPWQQPEQADGYVKESHIKKSAFDPLCGSTITGAVTVYRKMPSQVS